MRQIINIKLGDWLPDQGANLQENLSEARNVLPTTAGYAPMPGFQDIGLPPLPSPCENFIIHNNHIVTGCLDGLYAYKNQAWQKLHAKTTETQGEWSFKLWGEGILINHPAIGLLYYLLEKQEIIVLTSLAPRAKTMMALSDHVFLGGLADHPYRLAWSALNNPTDFQPNLATHADYQDLPHDKGTIQKITGDVVLTDKTLYQLRYVGVPYIWQLNLIPDSHGTIAPGSVVQHKDGLFYLASDGFYLFDGKKVQAIGEKRVNKAFFNRAKLDQPISSAVDPVRKLVFWSYINQHHKRELLIYNWETQQWSWSDQEATCLGYDNQELIGAYQNHLSALNGKALPAVLETGNHCFFPINRSWVTGITITNPDHPVEIGIQPDHASQFITYNPQKWQLFYPLRSNAYRHRLRLRFSGHFLPQKAVGIKVKALGK